MPKPIIVKTSLLDREGRALRQSQYKQSFPFQNNSINKINLLILKQIYTFEMD